MPTKRRPLLGPGFDAALAFAKRVHRHDTRKGKRTPHVSHLLGVCSLVLQHGGSEDEAIGARLHDTREDYPDTVTPALLRTSVDDGPMLEEYARTVKDFRTLVS